MSSTPVLSYKKPSANKTGAETTPASQNSSPQVSKPGTPRAGSSDDIGSKSGRKVSSRRKALQDFYHIQSQQQQERVNASNAVDEVNAVNEVSEAETTKIPKPAKVDLSNPQALQTFIKESPIEEILKLRNSITNDLNSHDSAKKSIIYDNYYELIKLNQVLGDLSKSKPNNAKNGTSQGLESLGISTEAENPTYDITDSYIDDVFNDLSEFIAEEASPFNSSFEQVVERLQQDADDANSAASIQGISGAEPVPKYPESLDKHNLVKEITAVLGNARLIQDDSIKKQYKDSIQKLLSKLNHKKDELLILQLNDLRKKFL